MRYVVETLPHQFRTFAGQVDEILLVLDTRQSSAFRAAADDFPMALAKMRKFLAEFCNPFPHARVEEVDYSVSTASALSEMFLGGLAVPVKACDGSAFYAYLFGLYRAKSNHVLHIDADLLFGGGSQDWTREAVELLDSNPRILACFPFPGPPLADGSPTPRRLTSIWNDVALKQSCAQSDLQRSAYEFNELSTRAFVIDRRRFESGKLVIPLVSPRLRRRLRSIVFDTSPYLLLEDCFTVLLNARSLRCVGFLGSGSGLWSLHIRYRSEDLFSKLATFIDDIERGNVPDAQRGDYDMNASMIDWTAAQRLTLRRNRYPREFRLAIRVLNARLNRLYGKIVKA